MRVDTVLNWLRFPEERRPHFVTLYFSDVDSAGHRSGPGTADVGSAVQEVDRQLGRLLDGLETLEIRDQVYVILVSDHGMSETSPAQYVSIESLIDAKRVSIEDAGLLRTCASCGTRRAPQVRDDINAKLEHGRAYLKADVPAKFHYNHSARIADVVGIMDEHYQIGSAERAPRAPGGAHGWDPDLKSMNGILFCHRPNVEGERLPLVSNLDIYPFIAELLRLQPAKNLDGKSGVLGALCIDRGVTKPMAKRRVASASRHSRAASQRGVSRTSSSSEQLRSESQIVAEDYEHSNRNSCIV
jgi:predicted AlkP superfamily pyrophosphatase or phosphodiesterase